ncbi:MAG: polysaccharide pyruvyl transferase family protein [Alphaproteobacteria bacterium]|nr:polysaccharide pyruvyl transferase family protein [Alphaproteobacteria bacterium]
MQADALAEAKRFSDALCLYKEILAQDRNAINILFSIARMYTALEKPYEASNVLRHIIRLQGKDAALAVYMMLMELQKKYMFWEGQAAVFDVLMKEENLLGLIPPFLALSMPMDNRQLMLNAERFVKRTPELAPKPMMFSFQGRTYRDRKIKLGFIGGDFRHHPTGFVLGELLETLDRNLFEVYLYDIFPDPKECWPQKRMYGAVDFVAQVEGMPPAAVAQRIHADGIDVLIDVNGLTMNHPLAVLTYQPAPAQATFLGFLGTLGGIPGVDYLFADTYCVPPSEQRFYKEKILYLEPTHRMTDSKIELPQNTYLRKHFGIPDDAVVLCCFNNSYKYTPNYFDLWARILKRVPKAVLWFYKVSPFIESNILKEFDKRHIGADRIMLTEMLPHAEHLGRYLLADLFLDTEYYNAHTTFLEALYMGCPGITCPGDTFQSRVGGSLLTALDMPDLICKDLKEYEDKVVDLAAHPDKLKQLRARVEHNIKTAPLFDIRRFARSFERNCLAMVEDVETKYAASTRQTLHPRAHAPKLETPPVKIFVWNGVNNLGDQLNYLILKALKIRHMNTHFSRCNFIAVGSLLDQFFLARDTMPKMQNPVKVWGSGFLAHPGEFGGDAAAPESFAAPMEFAALRGKLSKERCAKILGRDLGDIALGDPGLLVGRFFDISGIEKEYDVGFIPHHSELPMFAESARRLKKHSCVVIDATMSMPDALRKIAACRVIVSSGLHGLIVADSFGIPNRRMILSRKPVVSDFKFADYDSVFETPAAAPLRPWEHPITDEQIDAIVAHHRSRLPEIDAICDRLLAAFPFKPAD